MIRCSLILIAAVIVIVHLEQIDARSQKIDPDQDQFRPLKSSASSRSSISKTKLNLISGDDDHNGQPFSDQLLPLASDMIGQSASGSLMLNGYGGGYKNDSVFGFIFTITNTLDYDDDDDDDDDDYIFENDGFF
ncbi:hypothetical protein SSS_06361 [Sarcoptes scabiei]|uniref:Uncharacterized protein n=1 Tax=Sarcoptes scabiei TaxID=52283 RepID=A0A834RAA7_SARSC|nr:hypothetical protein SSS_06361 [Sarcoptes scabiei]